MCRHLVALGLRKENPGAELLRFESWPDDEPQPLFLDADADQRLQQWVRPATADSNRDARNRAIVALLLGTGVTAAETRGAHAGHVNLGTLRPDFHVPKCGPRTERTIAIPSFSTPALEAWVSSMENRDDRHRPLFPAPRGNGAINDMLLGIIVRGGT